MRWAWVVMLTAMVICNVLAQPLDRPIVGAVFFYWYEWEEDAEWGNWLGAVHNTPLYGYYDNRKVQDNFRSLLLAADWGLTHFFIDYWGHDWRGENNEPRETTVLKAAGKVRALGYPIFIGYYQDGENFEMREFWRNMSERRDTYRWLRDYARSPTWTWLFGKPFQMVYARNGVPALTIDHEGFQAWLRQLYGSIDKLNAEWGTRFRDFSKIRMSFTAVGFQRATSIAYQYERWQRDWAKLEQLIRDEFGLPGLRVSFDVGYSPFRGFGYEKFARVFGGPHSYGGIFGQPHEQDAERFLQAMVAKKCKTIFFDHFKHRYFDWNIRVPGTAYPPEPHHFDRFWVGNLMRFVDGVLHLSWNEWWEGSNLEPSFENGKHFCETNLLYSTIWQLTYFDTPHLTPRTQHEVGLLLNDWIFEHGGGDVSDLYNAVQGLRSVNASFDIVLQSEANLENLKRYRVIVAPAGSVGFGFNGKGERIDKVLALWLQLGGRTLITSQGGIKDKGQETQGKTTSSPAPRPSPHSFNFFVDIGSNGDEIVLVQGFSHREDWGKLPKGAFGAGSQATVRWTPAVGNTLVLLLPTDKILEGTPVDLLNFTARQEPRPPKNNSALRTLHSALILRWHGSAIWRNSVRIFVNEQFVSEVAIEPGWKVYEVNLPVSVLSGMRVIEVRFEFAEAHIPSEKEPQRFRGEQRVCNLALDWVQICTPDVPIGERKSVKWKPTELAEFVRLMQRTVYAKQFRAPLQRRRVLLPKGKIISTYADGIPRDLLIAVNSPLAPHPSSLLLVNSIFTDDPRWWATILEQVAKVSCGKFARLDKGSLPDRPNLMSAILTAGTTKFLLVENRTGKTHRLRLTVPLFDKLPIAEVVALSQDGNRFVPRSSSLVPFVDSVRYYAAYQVVFAPVRLSMPKWVAFPGQRTNLPITVRNLTDEPVTISLQIDSVIASVKGKIVTVRLKPKEKRQIALPVEVKPFADWGTKTVFVKGAWDAGRGARKTAYWLRTLMIGRNADVRCLTTAITSHTPTITIVNAPTTPFGDLSWWHPSLDVPGETARDVEIILRTNPSPTEVGAQEIRHQLWAKVHRMSLGNLPAKIHLSIGDLRDGELKQVRLPLPFTSSPVPRPASLTLRWRDSAGIHERTLPINMTLLPKDLPKTHPEQVATIVIPDAELAQGTPMSVELPESVKGDAFIVRLPDGTPLPTHAEKLVRSKAWNEVKCCQEQGTGQETQDELERHFANASWLTTNQREKQVHRSRFKNRLQQINGLPIPSTSPRQVAIETKQAKARYFKKPALAGFISLDPELDSGQKEFISSVVVSCEDALRNFETASDSKARGESECRQNASRDKLSRRIHFIVPPAKPRLRVDIGSEGNEQVLVRGFSHRETWAGGQTIRWLPGEGRETVLHITKPNSKATAHQLRLYGQAFWSNRVSVFVGEQKLTEIDVKVGWQTLTVTLPATLWEGRSVIEIRLVFRQVHIPAEKIHGSTDKRVCNFALDWLSLEPVFGGLPLLLSLCRADKEQTPSIAVQVQDGCVQVDNGVLELEWREDAGGTLTKFRSKATGRNYAAQSFGAGIGVFGRFDPQNPATTTDRFIVDDFVWQRNCKAKVQVVKQNPVWVTVEVEGHGRWDKGHEISGQRQGFKAIQRYRIFANLLLIELQVHTEPLNSNPQSLIPDPCELVVLEARFNAHWWTKSFPNFVGLGDKPPEVYGQHIVHFGWRMGKWIPPVLLLFNPNDLTETLSLLIVGNGSFNSSAWRKPRPPKSVSSLLVEGSDIISEGTLTGVPKLVQQESNPSNGANWVRQGFWGEQRGKPATERKYATIELIAQPPQPVRLSLWLWLHEGHHQQAKRQRQKLILPANYCVVPSKGER